MRPAKPELWIALGVLVPFAVLVAVGLWWSTPQRPPLTVATADAGADGARPAETGLSGAPAATPSRAPDADAGPSVPSLPSRPSVTSAAFPPELATPLEAVRAEVHRCLVDQDTRAPAHVEVTVVFRPTPSGGFDGVVVKPSWQDPYLEACVEDVFAEVRWVPSGRETFAPSSYTFQLAR
jgi:hypothetical protein